MKLLYLLSFIISDLTYNYVIADPERCTLPVMKGSCMASIPNYYYNTKTGQCEKFMYGGCGGNDNRFMSMDDCIQSCACQVSPDAGPCKAIKERWYYNPSRGCCEKFWYGGCQGNGNNFKSYEECNKICSGSFTINLEPKGLNWGSMKITSISGDRSMGGTFGKQFGGSRTVWLHNENAPALNKGVFQAMSRSANIPGGSSNYNIIGRELTGPGLVKAEKTRQSWSSGPIVTGGKRTLSVQSSGPMATGGMTSFSGGSGVMPIGGGGMSMGGRGMSMGGRGMPMGGGSMSMRGGGMTSGGGGMPIGGSMSMGGGGMTSGGGGMPMGAGGMTSGGGVMSMGGGGMTSGGGGMPRGGGGMTSGGGGITSGGGGFSMNSLSGKSGGKVNPGGFRVNSRGGVMSESPTGAGRGFATSMTGGSRKISSPIQPSWMNNIAV
ncbi:BPTI/Kunitz domain-containing protein [Mytilus coruscus]|uniref:BPTI/Kunitz domain-containing protein n=1 Tax=Mytilus coruscus TaxID=42192 RepID=A0A6J8BP20_MYTCO|nr:BPTI/Kunitz domain-containing protein [Mytilus coruscus]